MNAENGGLKAENLGGIRGVKRANRSRTSSPELRTLCKLQSPPHKFLKPAEIESSPNQSEIRGYGDDSMDEKRQVIETDTDVVKTDQS